MKTLENQAQNKVTIIGKLVDKVITERKTTDGRPALSAQATIRVTQTYGGKEETSEIRTSFFATKLTTKGMPNPAYQSLMDLGTYNSIQDVGYDKADNIRVTGGSIGENAYVSKNGTLVDNYRINGSFVSKTNTSDAATFIIDIFILDMHPEVDRDDDPTGRLVVRGAIVQYGGKLDVVEFIVEDPNNVDYIEKNWNEGDTVTVKGRIRATSVEIKSSGASSSWGEDVPDDTTKYINELIITKGDDSGKEEDFAYDPTEIKKGFNRRKAEIEQMQVNAKNKGSESKASSKSSKTSYDWQ